MANTKEPSISNPQMVNEVKNTIAEMMRDGVITAGQLHAAVRWEDPITVGKPVFKAKGGREV